MSLVVDVERNLGDFHLNVAFEMDGVSGLLGASGSGKSMTLMCIAGIVKPDRGRIVLNGRTLFDSDRHINVTPQRRHVGYLFQHYALFPDMTVRQNIACGMRGVRDKAAQEAKLREIVGILQLEGLERRHPNKLSGGQQQRVALARILVGEPELLMLDEPFAALDSHLRGQLQIETKKLLTRFGKDALLVTHSRDEAYHMCERIAVVDAGSVLVHKDAKQLFSDPESRQAALLTGCKNVVDATKSGEFEVEVPAWGVRFATAEPVREGLCAIGIRAHYFNPKTTLNQHEITFTDQVEGPFEYQMQFRYRGQAQDTPDIWWRIPKDKKPNPMPTHFGVAPVNVMLLYR